MSGLVVKQKKAGANCSGSYVGGESLLMNLGVSLALRLQMSVQTLLLHTLMLLWYS
jgi:hypothetical protein